MHDVTHQRDSFEALEQPSSDPGTLGPASPLPRRAAGDEYVDWLGFLRRQIWLMAAVWLAVMGLVAVVLYILPREYSSDAKFLVRTARQELVVGPNETAAAVRENVTEEMLNTELELLKSRDLLDKVVGELKLDRGYLENGKEREVARELAVRDLYNGLGVGAVRKTNIVNVSYMSRDAELAAAVVRHVAEGYLAAHVAMHSSPGTYDLFRVQAETAAKDLAAAETEMAALARTSNLVALDAQKLEALQMEQSLDSQLKGVMAELRENTTRARIADIHMASVPQRLRTTVRNVPNQYSVERLHTLIVELNNKRTEALTKFNPNDRFVVELDQQIKDTQAALDRAEGMSSSEEATDVNPAWQELESERMKARLAISGLESRAEQLRSQLAEAQKRVRDIAAAGPEYEAAVRKVAEARNRYDVYMKKEEEARIADALDKQRISNVVLAQAPVVSHVPAKPNIRLGVVVGAIVASFFALGLGFLREWVGVGLTRRRSQPLQVTVLGVTGATPELS